MLHVCRTTLILLLISTWSAEAQIDHARFIPLDAGNEWHFERYDDAGNPVGVDQFVVTGDTVLEGNVYAVYRKKSFEVQAAPSPGGAYNEHVCASRVVVSGGATEVDAEVVPLDGSRWSECQTYDCFPRPANELSMFEVGTTIISVAGQAYRVEATAWGGTMGVEPGGDTQTWETYSAYDIGPYLCEYKYNNQVRRRTRLQYANIGGKVYGRPTTDSEPTGPLGGSFGVSVYPNPFKDDLYLTISGAAGLVNIEVFDVLGQLVAKTNRVQFGFEPQDIEVNIPTRLPAGTYMVRVSNSGNVAAVLMTKM